MELNKQVCSLELSKQLKKLGVKQDSLFEYRLFDIDNKMAWSKPIIVGKIPHKLGRADVGFDRVSAFTVAELGEMFNKIDVDNFIKAYGEVFDFKGTQMVGLLGVINLMRKPDMAAKMLIYLIKNNLIKL